MFHKAACWFTAVHYFVITRGFLLLFGTLTSTYCTDDLTVFAAAVAEHQEDYSL